MSDAARTSFKGKLGRSEVHPEDKTKKMTEVKILW